MTRTDVALVIAALAACAGCAAPASPGEPSPAGMVPAAGFVTVATPVEIFGEHFDVQGVQAADGGSVVDATYRAWLGTTELLEVAWVDARTLHGRVPAGLAVGWHDLAVEGPHGRGLLANAYLVINGEPASLAISFAMPERVTVGSELSVTVTAENQGTWIVEQVLPAISMAGDGALDPVSGAAAAADLLPGERHDFVLRYTAARTGALSVRASIAGTDPRVGARVSAETSKAIIVRPPPSVTVIADNPFADGSAFAFVAGYRGQIYVGPNHDGTGLVRMAPDGTALASLDLLSFSRDTTGNQSDNSKFPYASIGFRGCTKDSVMNACGPDNEDGRGFMTSVAFAGDEWLVLGGARSGGDLDYVYMSRSVAAPLAFSYVDLSAALGGNTRGFSAALVAGDRLYLGFPDNGGERPYGVALRAAPPTPGGLDALQPSQVVNLNLHDAYNGAYGRFTSISMVDTIAEVGGHLYFFNNSGCVVATSLAPMTAADFTACSPVHAAYALDDAIDPLEQYDLEPRDRAWPAAVGWKGRLFAIRNTTTGPQLWRCDPAAGTHPSACDSADWTLVAADASLRTHFGRAGAIATLLLATETDLWIGFDDPVAGIHLFRTSADAPADASDFKGNGGCSADVLGCEGIGGDGFGTTPLLTRISDAKVIDWSGGTDVILTAGTGTGPVRIVRVAP